MRARNWAITKDRGSIEHFASPDLIAGVDLVHLFTSLAESTSKSHLMLGH